MKGLSKTTFNMVLAAYGKHYANWLNDRSNSIARAGMDEISTCLWEMIEERS